MRSLDPQPTVNHQVMTTDFFFVFIALYLCSSPPLCVCVCVWGASGVWVAGVQLPTRWPARANRLAGPCSKAAWLLPSPFPTRPQPPQLVREMSDCSMSNFRNSLSFIFFFLKYVRLGPCAPFLSLPFLVFLSFIFIYLFTGFVICHITSFPRLGGVEEGFCSFVPLFFPFPV